MFSKQKYRILPLLLAILLFYPSETLFADNTIQAAPLVSPSVAVLPSPTLAPAVLGATTTAAQQKAAEQAALQQQLDAIQNEIQQYQNQLSGIQSEKNTLANKVKQLQAQRAKINLEIQASNISIQNISDQIDQTQSDIDQNNQQLADLKNQMAGIIQQIYEQGDKSVVEILLANGGFSGFYTEFNDYQKVNQSLGAVLGKVKEENDKLALDQQTLSSQSDQQKNFVQIQSLQTVQLSQTLSEQNNLLATTKGKEADYQVVLNDSKKRAADIQGRIYDLLGISKQVTFGQAVEIANYVSGQTGVRPAFVLAILNQESSLGKNVGTCNRAGDPPTKSWRVVMKPDRDQQPFQEITAELGLDIDVTPVSCPMHDAKGRQVGWGGAMGPAQFIPSTWMGYRGKVAAITGKPANPWDIRDAFLASAIKLAADGGTSQSGEWAAAMRYFSGGTNVKYRFYGDNVVATAAKYQADIDALNAQ